MKSSSWLNPIPGRDMSMDSREFRLAAYRLADEESSMGSGIDIKPLVFS